MACNLIPKLTGLVKTALAVTPSSPKADEGSINSAIFKIPHLQGGFGMTNSVLFTVSEFGNEKDFPFPLLKLIDPARGWFMAVAPLTDFSVVFFP